VADILNKIPGIDHDKQLNINVMNSKGRIDIVFAPLSSIYNIYDIVKEVQDSVYFKLTKIFDLDKLNVNVTAISGESK
jgi:uncharacterized alkaline shock family protein YloU